MDCDRDGAGPVSTSEVNVHWINCRLSRRGDMLAAFRTVLVEGTELTARISWFDLDVTSFTAQTGNHQIQFAAVRVRESDGLRVGPFVA